MKTWLGIPVILVALATSSCENIYRPKAAIPIHTFSAPYIADLTSPTLLTAYDAMPEGPAKVARRNQILYELMRLIDFRYEAYESSFFAGQAYVSTASDAAVLGLSAAGGVVGDAALKSILAVVSGGVVGIHSSYQKNFFDQATRESIVQQMRASRLTTRAIIEAGMMDCTSTVSCPNPSQAYTLEQGFLDLDDYYSDGTVVDALIAISNSTSQQAATARAALRVLRATVKP
jgi:hypothetical protein